MSLFSWALCPYFLILGGRCRQAIKRDKTKTHLESAHVAQHQARRTGTLHDLIREDIELVIAAGMWLCIVAAGFHLQDSISLTTICQHGTSLEHCAMTELQPSISSSDSKFQNTSFSQRNVSQDSLPSSRSTSNHLESQVASSTSISTSDQLPSSKHSDAGLSRQI